MGNDQSSAGKPEKRDAHKKKQNQKSNSFSSSTSSSPSIQNMNNHNNNNTRAEGVNTNGISNNNNNNNDHRRMNSSYRSFSRESSTSTSSKDDSSKSSNNFNASHSMEEDQIQTAPFSGTRNTRTRKSVGSFGTSTTSTAISLEQADERRSKFRGVRYQSVRGTKSEPKLKNKHIFNNKSLLSSPTNSRENSIGGGRPGTASGTTSATSGSVDEHFEKMKISKKGKRIATIRSMQCELWDPFQVGDRTSLEFSLCPSFSVTDQPGELTCHTLKLNFLEVPADKLEQRLELYDFEIIFTETKFAINNNLSTANDTCPVSLVNMTNSQQSHHKLIRGHTFYGMSRSVKVTDRVAVIEGNFYNPEYGKMDFFQFELCLVPSQFRELDRPPADTINKATTNVEDLVNAARRKQCFDATWFGGKNGRFRQTWWGTFLMKVRGSYKSKEYMFQIFERPLSTETPLRTKANKNDVISKSASSDREDTLLNTQINPTTAGIESDNTITNKESCML